MEDLPVVIPCFNNPTYLRAMVEQLLALNLGRLIIADNASSYPPLLAYLDELQGRFTVVRWKENRGPRALVQDANFYDSLPDCFAITDPDLVFHHALPRDFVAQLLQLTQQYQVGKAGFALDISQPEQLLPEPFQIGDDLCRIWEWEAQFWKTPLPEAGQDPAYRALIDTTFAIYNKTYFRRETHLDGIRVAGRYTARHLPWYRENKMPADEYAFYRATSKHSFYVGTPPAS
ncbi:MAG: glycosyltransferase [Chthoniobacterales bacterium]